MGKSTTKVLCVAIAASAITFGVSIGLAKGGQRPPDTFEIVNVDGTTSPEPSVLPSPSATPAQMQGPPRPMTSRVAPASPWSSPEISAGGGQGGGGVIITPSAKPVPKPRPSR